jgi:hypothetical protein
MHHQLKSLNISPSLSIISYGVPTYRVFPVWRPSNWAVSLMLGVKVKSTNKVTRFVAGRELELQNTTGTVQFKVNFHLASKYKNTLVVCSTTVSSDIQAFAFSGPILRKLAQRELQSDMQALKIAVENQLT